MVIGAKEKKKMLGIRIGNVGQRRASIEMLAKVSRKALPRRKKGSRSCGFWGRTVQGERTVSIESLRWSPLWQEQSEQERER